MKEFILEIANSERKKKKYVAIVEDKNQQIRRIHFGNVGYDQWHDQTTLKLYSHCDHNDATRRRNHFMRVSHVPTKDRALELEIKLSKGIFNEKILSHFYLY